MSGILRKFGKSIFVTITFFSTALFLFASYNHLFDPDKRWYIALTGLALPLLLLFQLLVALCWLFMRSRWVLIPFASLLIGFPAIRTIIAFHAPQTFYLQKDSASIRVMSWNVSWFDGQSNQKRKPGLYRQAMLDFIKDQQADILCFQEYLEPGDKGAQNSHSSILRAMGYAYNHWVGDYVRRNGRLNAGTAIFSKYPIRQTYRWKYEGLWFERVAESLIAADIDVNGQTIRVYTTHLQSLQFNDGDYQTIESIKDPDRTSLKESLGIIRKIRVGYKYRLRQAQLVREQLDASPYPEILCGDFNDVPRSFAYTTIRGNRNDAFLEKGTGIGRTFHAISPTLRIDYILTHPDFKVVQFHKKDFHFSEHYPIMADIQLN